MAKLLIVEDDLLLDEAYRRKFSESYDLRIATDGESAIKMAMAFVPDVILLDIYMPGRFNGLDVLEQVRKNNKTAEIPILIVTNLPDVMEKISGTKKVKCYMKTEVDLNLIGNEIETMIEKSST